MGNQSTKSSYTSASALPMKVLQDADLVSSMRRGYIPLVHLQFTPTNRCNLNCSFCSCSEREQGLEMPLGDILKLVAGLPGLGCRAVTITGGGEPLLHPHINDIIAAFAARGIRVGLVTNGTQFHRLTNQGVTWCRISASDDRTMNFEAIAKAVLKAPLTDWAFSYVLTRDPNWHTLASIVGFANEHKFTHVRLVGDILDHKESAKAISLAADVLSALGVDDQLVIYQPRAAFSVGREKCLISLLKPMVAADGYVYPCCNVQYALDPPSRDMDRRMRMGRMEDIKEIWEGQSYFDGSRCVCCYYDDYNNILDLMSTRLDHREFL